MYFHHKALIDVKPAIHIKPPKPVIFLILELFLAYKFVKTKKNIQTSNGRPSNI